MVHGTRIASQMLCEDTVSLPVRWEGMKKREAYPESLVTNLRLQSNTTTAPAISTPPWGILWPSTLTSSDEKRSFAPPHSLFGAPLQPVVYFVLTSHPIRSCEPFGSSAPGLLRRPEHRMDIGEDTEGLTILCRRVVALGVGHTLGPVAPNPRCFCV